MEDPYPPPSSSPEHELERRRQRSLQVLRGAQLITGLSALAGAVIGGPPLIGMMTGFDRFDLEAVDRWGTEAETALPGICVLVAIAIAGMFVAIHSGKRYRALCRRCEEEAASGSDNP